MCHITNKNFETVGPNPIKVYKVAVESIEHEDPFSLTGSSFFANPVWGFWNDPIFRRRIKYNTIFTGSEIKLNSLMYDDMTYSYVDNENIGPGYYHFFKTKEEASEFLKRIAIICDFNKYSCPCILVGEIPVGELYNEGTFKFEGVEYASIVSKTVYYGGELYYE